MSYLLAATKSFLKWHFYLSIEIHKLIGNGRWRLLLSNKSPLHF